MTDRHYKYNHSDKGQKRTKRHRDNVSANLPKCSICGGAIPRRPNSIAIAIGYHRRCNVTLYRQEEVRRRSEK